MANDFVFDLRAKNGALRFFRSTVAFKFAGTATAVLFCFLFSLGGGGGRIGSRRPRWG